MENKYNNINSEVNTVAADSAETAPEITAPETPAPEALVQPVQTAPDQQYARPVQPAPAQQFNPPARQLRANRSMLLTVILTIITLGIYGLVTYTQFSDEINVTASKYDGKKTMNFCLLFFLVGPLTLGIGYLVWNHKFSKRVGDELARRNISYSFGAGSFWLWNTIGLLILVGPLVYLHKLCKAMNLINADYNQKG